MTDIKTRLWAENARRVLNTLQLLRCFAKDFSENDLTDKRIVKLNAALISSLNFYLSELKKPMSAETWKAVKADLNSEKLKDISLLLDVGYEVDNTGELADLLHRELLAQRKTLAAEATTSD